MLNPFPSLLTYALFAPTLLRLVAALIFAYVAFRQWKHRHELTKLQFPIVPSGAWIPWFSVIVGALVTASLFFGYGTQWGALLGGLLALKGAVWQHRYPTLYPLSRTAFVLAAVICVSLLLSGAGAFAFDIAL